MGLFNKNKEPKPDKKKFRDTKVGAFLAEKAPDILHTIGDVADDYFPPAKILTSLFEKQPKVTQEDKLAFNRMMLDYELEVYKAEVEDRDSARTREVEIAKTGKADIMMIVTGSIGLAVFALMVVTIFFYELKNEAMAHQLIGVIEGVALTMFAYYFGSSKGSKEKTQILKNNDK